MPRKKKTSSNEFSNNISAWHKNVPLLYDAICQIKLECPSYACTFGHLLSEHKNETKYRLFQSRATNANYLKDKHIWQGLPHALLICDISIPLKTDTDNTANDIIFEETKRIIHPGPILRIKQMPQFPQIVATHTQHKYVFLWNTSTQHDRDMVNNSDPNTPELILKGHKKDAVYALDFSRNDCLVASGSKDQRICIWNISDYKSVLSSANEPDKKERFVPLSRPSPKLKPRIILKGHSKEVTDVEFAPDSPHIIGSVSCDKSFKVWDIRCNNNGNGTTEIDKCKSSIDGIFDKEMTNLSWNLFDTNYILIAAKDGCIKLLDLRNVNGNESVIKEFKGHSNRISSLEWNPSHTNQNYFLSSSHDGTVLIWDMNSANNNCWFKHIGHMNHYKGSEVLHSASWIKGVKNGDCDSMCVASTSSNKAFVPFFWSSSSENSSHNNGNASVSVSNENPNEGGLLHAWKPSVLLTMNRDEIIKHLKEQKKSRIAFVDDLGGNKKEKREEKEKGKKKKKKKRVESIDEMDNHDNDVQMIDKSSNQ